MPWGHSVRREQIRHFRLSNRRRRQAYAYGTREDGRALVEKREGRGRPVRCQRCLGSAVVPRVLGRQGSR